VRISINSIFAILALAASASICHAAGNDVLSWVEGNDIGSLNKYYGDIQHGFESGAVTEVDLRNAYRPLYMLDATGAKNLTIWAEGAPRSYVAHLALGIYLKKLGEKVRGEKFVEETPVEKLIEAESYFARANRELSKSLSLTSKPYLSIFHMLSIAAWMGERSNAETLLTAANKMFPSNALARCRFVKILLPRWGGSYGEADAFIAATQKEGVAPGVIYQLQAIKEDDIGHTLVSKGDHAAANEHFVRALQLAERSGGTVSSDWLQTSRYFICRNGSAVSYCK
jgi:tetratricopeptide (TPR) repeat protein